MDVTAAQADFNRSYAGGAAGVLISGLVWIISGLVWQASGTEHAVLALFFGGMAIHPAATGLARFVLHCPPAAVANPLTRLALESTFALFAGVLIAYVLIVQQPALAIPAFAVILGMRYFVFRTLFGTALFWALGGAITALGALALLSRPLPLGNLAWQIGAAELVFAALLFARWHKQRAGKPE